MPNTPKSQADLLFSFPDNTTRLITPQRIRDFVVSTWNNVDHPILSFQSPWTGNIDGAGHDLLLDGGTLNGITVTTGTGTLTLGAASITMNLSGANPAGNIFTSAGSGTGAGGGWIITNGGTGSGASGGDVNTSGTTLNGGSIYTANGGGSINTAGTGLIELGANGTRTSLNGSATTNRTITLPDATGTVALLSDLSSYVTLTGTESLTNKTLGNTDNASAVSVRGFITITDGSTVGTATIKMRRTSSLSLAGNINTSGGSGFGAFGGSVNTYGNGGWGGDISTFGGTGGATGGDINTSGGTASGGSIDTHDGGGLINTRGTGQIQLGVSGSRTTLYGDAPSDITINFPAGPGILDLAETITTTASSATPTPVGGGPDIYGPPRRNLFTVTALAVDATFAVPSGTPINGNKLSIRIKDNGTARALAWNAIYRGIGLTLPTTTVISKTIYLSAIYNSADAKWDVVSCVVQDAIITVAVGSITGLGTDVATALAITADASGGVVTVGGNSNTNIGAVGITIDGGGSAVTTGIKGYVNFPYAGTIISATLVSDVTGSCVIDVWKLAFNASALPTVANTITASAKPTLSSAVGVTDSTLTGWTTSVSAGDTFAFKVDSASTITKATLTLKIRKA